jgi:predicted phosphodiesterase
MGNVDRNVLRIKEKLEGYRLKHKWDKAVSYSWTAAQLDESSRRYLEGLPAERRLEIDAVPIHLVHGTLGSDSIGLRAGMGEREAERLLRQSKARLLACGHTHLAFVLELAEGVLANCGSVGRPYDGALGASYLVVDTAPRLVVQVRTVPYDSLALQAGFEARGLPASFFEAISSGRGFTPRDQDNLRAWDQIQATRR